jgi:SAM-dependent methyltransferase
MADDAALERQRAAWERSSDGWHAWDDVVAAMLEPTGRAMVQRLAPHARTRHLDVATGTGEPGLSIAAIALDGRVVLSDFAEGMLSGVRQRVAERDYSHVDVVTADAGALPFADASFDSVSCRFGCMFFPDIAAAAREFARVLEPGGVVCVAVWAEPEHNPWALIPQRELSRVVALEPPPPDAPGVFRCSAPGFMIEVFDQAGFDAITEEEVAITASLHPAERFWDFTAAVAAPVVAGLALTDDEGRARVRAATLAAVEPFRSGAHLDIPGLSRIVTARKPVDA